VSTQDGSFSLALDELVKKSQIDELQDYSDNDDLDHNKVINTENMFIQQHKKKRDSKSNKAHAYLKTDQPSDISLFNKYIPTDYERNTVRTLESSKKAKLAKRDNIEESRLKARILLPSAGCVAKPQIVEFDRPGSVSVSQV
jgi:hypothetical protein